MNHSTSADVVVIGGGVIGLSITWHLLKKGLRVTLLDAGDGSGQASRAGAGMLGAQVEIDEPGPMYDLCVESRDRYIPWIDALESESGVDIERNAAGILRIAESEEDLAHLRRKMSWQTTNGQRVTWLDDIEAVRLAGTSLPTVRGALHLQDDHQIRVPQLLLALRTAIARMPSATTLQTRAMGFRSVGTQVAEVVTREGAIPCGQVVIAGGAWTRALGEELETSLSITPIKGQSMLILCQSPPTPFTIFTHGTYIIPKRDGTVYVGASEQHSGFDPTPDAAVHEHLSHRADRLMPALLPFASRTPITGLRPLFADGLPVMGLVPARDNAYVASGHFRNGVLLSAATGYWMAELLCDAPESAARRLRPFAVREQTARI